MSDEASETMDLQFVGNVMRGVFDARSLGIGVARVFGTDEPTEWEMSRSRGVVRGFPFLPTSLPTYLTTYLPTYPANLLTSLPPYLPTYIPRN